MNSAKPTKKIHQKDQLSDALCEKEKKTEFIPNPTANIVYYVPGTMLILSFNHQATFAFQGQIKQLKTEEISED